MYDNPYMNHLQYYHYPDMGQSQIADTYNQIPDSNAASNAYMQQRFNELSPDQVNQYSSQFNPPPPKVDPNAPTEEQIMQKQKSAAVGNAANSVIGAVPVYGQIIGAATAASNIGKSLLPKDEYGNVKGKFNKGLEAEMTPVHQQVIDDITAKNYGGAALAVITGGQYKAFKEWFK